MKKIKNKLLASLLVVATILEMFIPSMSVSAVTFDDELYIDYNYEWWVATKGFSGKKFTAQPERMIRRRSDNKPVYCIQPQIKFNDNSSVHGVTDLTQMLQMSGLTLEQIQRVTLISYYGYGYGNHTAPEWFYATQMMIWQITQPGWTYAIADNDESVQPSNRYDTYYNEINALVDKHVYQPSFHQQKVQMKVGETITLTDSNNVLDKYYTGVENDHFKAEIVGNQLKITAKTAYDGKIELVQKENQNPPMIYTGANQLVFPMSDPDSQYAYVQLESLIEVNGKKYYGSNADGVYRPERNAEFEIYNAENNELISTVTTDIDGNFKYYFAIGSYRIHQIKGQEGYKFIKDFTFSVDENSVKEVFVFKNEVLGKGTLEFSKEDLSTGDPLPNTLVEIYDAETNEKVFSDRTDENGKIIVPDLSIGKYYILEKEAPKGYTINPERMYFEIKEDGEIVKATMKDEKIKAKVQLHKTDENGTPLAGVVFGLYDEEGNLISKYTTDENGNIEVEVEYGKYYWQEISTLDGYELNQEKIYFEVTKDGEVIENSLVNKSIEKKVEVPDTLKNANYIIELVSGSLILTGIGVVAYEIIKKRKQK